MRVTGCRVAVHGAAGCGDGELVSIGVATCADERVLEVWGAGEAEGAVGGEGEEVGAGAAEGVGGDGVGTILVGGSEVGHIGLVLRLGEAQGGLGRLVVIG